MHIRPLAFDDLFEIQLRQADKDELAALYNADPQTGLLMAYRVSVPEQLYTVESEEGLVAVFGFARHPQDAAVGVGWMLGSDLITKRWVTFARLTPEIVTKEDCSYDMLFNYVDTRNQAHLRWLEYAGFTTGHVNHTLSPLGLPFQAFWRFTSCADQPQLEQASLSSAA
jgi:hypothetical protein